MKPYPTISNYKPGGGLLWYLATGIDPYVSVFVVVLISVLRVPNPGGGADGVVKPGGVAGREIGKVFESLPPLCGTNS